MHFKATKAWSMKRIEQNLAILNRMNKVDLRKTKDVLQCISMASTARNNMFSSSLAGAIYNTSIERSNRD